MALAVTEALLTRPHDDEEPVEAIYIGGGGALADLYKFKLEMDGYRVTLAPTGTEGLAQARERLPDIVFIELGPADQSLLRTHRLLRQDRELKDVPAVLLWRGDTDEPTIQGLHLGAKDFLVKANGTHTEPASSDFSESRLSFRYVQ
jgi:PleD family two-component response regulator